MQPHIKLSHTRMVIYPSSIWPVSWQISPLRCGRGLIVKRLVLLFAALGTATVAVVLVSSGDGLLNENRGPRPRRPSRPNFVFVMTDDLDERSMEQLGGIRSIMGANGITFENAFVTYALCCPSRATFFRGQYPHNHGITGDATPLGASRSFGSWGGTSPP